MFKNYLPFELFQAEQDALNARTNEQRQEAEKRRLDAALNLALRKHY